MPKFGTIRDADSHFLSEILPMSTFWVAGGRALSYYKNVEKKYQDIDLFFDVEEDIESAVFRLLNNKKMVPEKVIKTKNAYTFKYDGRNDLQLIRKIYGSIDYIFSSFDMCNVQVAYRYDWGLLHETYNCTPGFLESQAKNEIMLLKVARNTISRVIKMSARGYILSDDSLEMIKHLIPYELNGANALAVEKADEYELLSPIP